MVDHYVPICEGTLLLQHDYDRGHNAFFVCQTEPKHIDPNFLQQCGASSRSEKTNRIFPCLEMQMSGSQVQFELIVSRDRYLENEIRTIISW